MTISKNGYLKELIESFDNQKLVKTNGKNYLIIPLTDHVGATPAVILRQAVNAICDIADFNGVTKVVGEEEKGGFIAVCVALQRHLAFSLAKQNPVNIPDEVEVVFKMAYSDSMKLYLNGVYKGDNVVLIDDMVDSGGTLIALINAVKSTGANILDVICLAEKVEFNGVERVFKETGIKVKTILKVDTTGDYSKVTEPRVS